MRVRKRAARAEEAGELQPGIKKILLYPPLLSLSLSKEPRYSYPTGKKEKEVDYLTPLVPVRLTVPMYFILFTLTG